MNLIFCLFFAASHATQRDEAHALRAEPLHGNLSDSLCLNLIASGLLFILGGEASLHSSRT